MATVIIGSARIDENGNAHGGKAGDQTGKELSTQNWYLHKKGWRVFRCIDPEKAKKIAACMKAACANSKIGYDQYDRLTLYNVAKNVGFDCSKVTTACETDCSALVRVCLAFAGITVANFRTTDEASKLLGSGMFVELTESKYRTKSTYLRTGDVLCTPVQGHTVVVLNDGSGAESDVPPAGGSGYNLGDRLLKNGCAGSDVMELQNGLIALGYSCGSYGADGEFGDATEIAVIKFQRDNGLETDGEFGSKSFAAYKEATKKPAAETGSEVEIVNGNCYIRTLPDVQTGAKVGVAHEGAVFEYAGETASNGWLSIRYNGSNTRYWVSNKYARLKG